MATVGAKLGLTLKISRDSQYEFIRPEISIEGIDTDQPIEPQLKLAVEAIKQVWDTVTNQISDEILAKMPNMDAQLELQVNKRIKIIENNIKDLEKKVKDSTKV